MVHTPTDRIINHNITNKNSEHNYTNKEKNLKTIKNKTNICCTWSKSSSLANCTETPPLIQNSPPFLSLEVRLRLFCWDFSWF